MHACDLDMLWSVASKYMLLPASSQSASSTSVRCMWYVSSHTVDLGVSCCRHLSTTLKTSTSMARLQCIDPLFMACFSLLHMASWPWTQHKKLHLPGICSTFNCNTRQETCSVTCSHTLFEVFQVGLKLRMDRINTAHNTVRTTSLARMVVAHINSWFIETISSCNCAPFAVLDM